MGKGPGERYSTVATKAWKHKGVAVEAGHAGIAFKVDQPHAIPDPTDAAAIAAAQTVAIGADVVIDMDGVHDIPSAQLPAGAVVGTQLWINPAAAVGADLLDATATGAIKFGIVDAIDTVLGRATVNLTQRSSF
jgi:hypothetical protein